MMKKAIKYTAATVTALLTAQSGNAAELSTNTAIMQAMDKITGQVNLIEVPVNQETAFGSLSIVVRECKTRTPEETPENFAFVDVVDKSVSAGDVNIFKGWMLSSSPALNPVAHPVYDVWLLKCTNKLIDPKNLMTKEQLEERDTITMNRDATEKAFDEAVQENQAGTPFSQIADGEPINLIPDDVAENDTNTEAAADILTENKPVLIEEQAGEPIGEKETGAPQALVDFSVSQNVELVSEKIEQEADFETIDITSQTNMTAPEQTADKQENNGASSNANEKDEKQQDSNVDDEMQTSAKPVENSDTASSVTAQVNKPPVNSDDIINRLEQELSAKLIGE